MEFNHTSVLCDESIKFLNINPDGIYIDGTMGGAGHSYKICKKLTTGKFIGIDQDINAINISKKRLEEFNDKIILVHNNFSNIKNILNDLNIKKVDGVLLDIGVSSHQLDEANRGFSYMQNAPLDMRMNIDNNFSAYNVVNEYSEKKLSDIIYKFGEERWAKRIAEFIVNERKNKFIETTFELVDIIKKAIPKSCRIDGPHPAKRTFQAIRIEVNSELDVLKIAINDIIDFLNPKGRLAIITFHSLEDRIVKNEFKKQQNPCECPIEFPVCICNNISKGKVITKKPILPSDKEILENHRARSAKLRVFERI